MIASVRGQLIERGLDYIVVEAGGLGYHLSVSTETLKAVPELGQEVDLLTELVVRDDAFSLFGFSSAEERQVFQLLTSVSGVGPKVAVAALSSDTPRNLTGAIATGDAASFKEVPGIGRRTSERIILELKDKVEPLDGSGPRPAPEGDERSHDLARAGLMGLGYDSGEAEQLLRGVDGGSAEEQISAALRAAAAGGGG